VQTLSFRIYQGRPVIRVSLVDGAKPPRVICELLPRDDSSSSLKTAETVDLLYSVYKALPLAEYQLSGVKGMFDQ
jgi:hypothetical protein